MEEALELRAQARKKAKSTSLLFKISSKSQKIKSEIEQLDTKAATLFLRLEKYPEAAESFSEAAHYATSVYTVASLNVEAAKASLKANDLDKAIKCYTEAVKIFATKGPLRRAAELSLEVGKIFEKQQLPDQALSAYLRAVDWYKQCDESVKAAEAEFECAGLFAELNKFQEAIECFERAALHFSSDRASRFKLKHYFLRAGLCYLAAHDLVGCDLALDRYCKLDRAFSSTDQFVLLKSLLAALRGGGLPQFEQTLYNYDKRHRLNKWEVEISLKIKENLAKPGGELL